MEGQRVATREIKINGGYFLNILLFPDDLLVIASTGDDLQKQIFI